VAGVELRTGADVEHGHLTSLRTARQTAVVDEG